MVNGKVISLTNRVPANVTGDGTSTVGQLIEIKNKHRTKSPYYSVRKIPTDIQRLDALREMNLDLSHIPSKNAKVFLKHTANVSTGGDSINCTALLSEKLENIIISAVKTIPGLIYTCLDVLVKDISSENPEYTILEMNAYFAPTAMFHTYGESVDMLSPIIDYYRENY